MVNIDRELGESDEEVSDIEKLPRILHQRKP